MKKIICLFTILILLSGCTTKDAYYYKDMSQTVLSLFQDLNYNEKDYSNEENKAIQKIISELTHENQKINVSDFIIESQEYKVNESNSSEIFIEDGECYIYYEDLDYEEYSNHEDHYELEPHKRLVCNGYYTVLYSSDFYPDYELTKQNPTHHYAYIDFNETNNGYSYIYKSTYDGSYLVVDINTKDFDIDLLDNVREEEIIIEEKESSIFPLIITIIIFAALIFGLIKFKKKREEKY